jgi:hypothetical protein
MSNNKIEEIELPGEEDVNVGEGAPKKKREKRRKSKEERIRDRKVVFWALVITFVLTIVFWMMPYFQGKKIEFPNIKFQTSKQGVQSEDQKNYKEYNNL